MNLRSAKIARLFQKEISMIIGRELTNSDIGFVTVTAVQFNKDMSLATVYVSIFGTDGAKAKSIIALNHAKGVVRHSLAGRVVLRHMPDIEFREDVQLNQIERTLNIIKKIEDGDKKVEK
ncbi:MAG: ribosome-binding factor A [Candidatus Firestonebacteria bacterium RIFOXYA2_FULL_40_8]|nr:MAG: ribosome-binding factor A [Candidatus Firestonebacteria bacterium RIFOXYA2_FULL_40_8]